jgi:hypothetical protein
MIAPEIVVTESYAEPGFCRQYYNVVSIKGNEVNRPMWICAQEEADGIHLWYTTSNDGDYNEPDSMIRSEFVIRTVDGQILRDTVLTEPLFSLGQTVRHKRTKGEYIIRAVPDINRRLEASGNLFYEYQSAIDSVVWVREQREMEDGRFEAYTVDA